MKGLEKKVYDYPTKNEEGFINSEIEELLKDYPEVDMDLFDGALMGNTCMMRDGDTIMYHCDIYKALCCGLRGSGLKPYEWD